MIDTKSGNKQKIVDNLQNYRVRSPVFRLNVSPDSPIKDQLDEIIQPGTYDAVTEGYYLFIKPLEPGEYQFQYFAKATEGDYKYKSIYDITVEDEPKAAMYSGIDKSDKLLS
jgi:hypothetical protein